ncbi:Glycosyltransferase [Flavobacteriales bacterium ALC-1]|nr:Glycosyltransferase [Flavobacteriales bacterium ALC-1]
MNILISIIIPVYNVEDYLDRCIESLINQTYKNLEIILVNDGSKDSSGAICDRYALNDDRIKVYHIENGGSSIARNYGLKKSKGDYIGFVDSDDWVKPEMFEQLISFAIKNNLKVIETSSVHSHLVKEGTVKNNIITAKIEDKNTALKRIIKNKRFAVWRRIYQRSILQDRYFIEGILHQDVYYTLDIINEVSQIGYFENQHYVYNVQNPTSVIRSDYSIKKLNSINAGKYVVDNTTQYSNDIQDLAKQYMFEFLTHHYDALYFNQNLDKDGVHRKNIRNTIKKYHSRKNFNFYSYAIVILPPVLYKIFLFINKKRIKIQSKISQTYKNV